MACAIRMALLVLVKNAFGHQFRLQVPAISANLASAEVDFWQSQLPQRVMKSHVLSSGGPNFHSELPITTAIHQLPQRVIKCTKKSLPLQRSRVASVCKQVFPTVHQFSCFFSFFIAELYFWRHQLPQRVMKSNFDFSRPQIES